MAETKKTSNKTANKTTAKKSTAKKPTKKVTAKASTKKAPAKKIEKKAEVKPVVKKTTKAEVKPVDTYEARLKEKKNKKGIKGWFEKLSLEQIIFGGVAIIAILLIVLIIVSCRNTKTKNGEEIVAKLNGKTITADELYTKLKSAGGRSTIVDMIDNYILEKEYKTTDDMKKSAESTISSYKSNYGDNYSSFLQYNGIDNDDQLKEMLIKNEKQTKVTEKYIKDNITESEMKKYYNDNIVGDIKASHILISVAEDATDEEKDAAKKKAEDIIKELKDGGDFAKLAKKYSEDTESKKDGGNLGYFNTGDMLEAFEKAAYALDLNQYTTEPVETTYGYHIIMKTGEKDKPSYEKSKDTIKEKIVKDKEENDTTITAKAMAALRKEYKLTFKDKTIKKDYKTYVQDSITTTTTTTAATTSTSN